eukprot:6212139-Pleurochrysis_carterae.AAC.2
MHCFPICTRAACVLAERSALRSPSFGPPQRVWHTPPDCATDPEPPRRRASAPAPATAPRPHSARSGRSLQS